MLWGDLHHPLPDDETVNTLFLLDVLCADSSSLDAADCAGGGLKGGPLQGGGSGRSGSRAIPVPFENFFCARGDFSWSPVSEAREEKEWPLGPICSLDNGKLWPAVFLAKKGFYLLAVVGLLSEKHVAAYQNIMRLPAPKKCFSRKQLAAIDLPEVTAAFVAIIRSIFSGSFFQHRNCMNKVYDSCSVGRIIFTREQAATV